MKNSPLQQAHAAPTNDSNASMNLRPSVGLGLDRSASILSHSSHVSDSGSTKGSRVRNLLSRSKSQPRLPLHPQESYISITSDRSSLDERAKSPPNISQAVLSHVMTSLIFSNHGRRLMEGLPQTCQWNHSTRILMITALQSASPTPFLKPLSAKKTTPVQRPSSMKNSKNTPSSCQAHPGPKRASSNPNAT